MYVLYDVVVVIIIIIIIIIIVITITVTVFIIITITIVAKAQPRRVICQDVTAKSRHVSKSTHSLFR